MLAVKAAADLGPLLLDGLADGIWIDAPGFSEAEIRDIELMILQAARVRFSHTEYIACPSCGRTLYDIEKALADIKARTSHLKNLRIGVMGCIVNGPGEMADADYGYVGAGPGRITLYKGPDGRRAQHSAGGGPRPVGGADSNKRGIGSSHDRASPRIPSLGGVFHAPPARRLRRGPRRALREAFRAQPCADTGLRTA